MTTFKDITIRIPIEVYERLEKLSPSRKWGTHRVRDFMSDIFLKGLEHPSFIKMENKRQTDALKWEIEYLKRQATKNGGQPPSVPSVAFEGLVKMLDNVQGTGGVSGAAGASS